MVSLLFIDKKSIQKDQNSPPGKLQIVSLAPSVTEMLFVLGLGDSIVAATDHCDYPPEAKQIERVGGLGSPNIERLLALSPDLVIATDFEHNNVPEMLRKAGIEVLELEIGNIQEMFDAFEKIGSATGKTKRSEEIIATMRKDLKTVAKQHEKIPQDQRKRVFVEIWDDPITTVGRGSFIHELITLAGGINVAGDLSQSYLHINPEMVIEWNPDVILVCSMNRTEQTATELAGRIGWGEITAVRQRQIICDIPNDLMLRPGPRLIEGVKILAKKLYGAESAKD